MQALTPPRRTGLIVGLLIVGTVAVYWPLWNAQFLSVDDPSYVCDNSTVLAGLTWHGVKWAFDGVHVANYHPLTWLSHMLDCQLFGAGPRWPHIENLVFHILNSILVFVILRRMTGREFCPALVALLFAIHPVHVESVAWVAERKDVLSAFFWLLTMLAYAWYVDHLGIWRYLLMACGFALALLSKPMAVTLPCALLLLDIWPLRRIPQLGAGQSALPPLRQWTGLITEKLPLFAMSGGWCVVTYLAQSRGGAVMPLSYMTLGDRVGNALVSYVRYVGHFLLPTDLAAFYPLNHRWALWTCALAGAALVLVTLLVLLNWHRRPYLTFGWFWFLGTLVPVIGLVQVGNAAMADRYMYLPMLGLAVTLVWALADAAPWLWNRRLAAAAITSMVLLVLALITTNDVRYWGNSDRLYTRAIARTEPNVFALSVVGTSRVRRHDFEGAARAFAQSVRLQPQNPDSHRALGSALAELKQYDRARREIATAIKLDPAVADSWSAMGILCMDLKQWHASADKFERAVTLKPGDAGLWENLAIAHHELHDYPDAGKELDRALALEPDRASSWMMRGLLLMDTKHPADAATAFARSVNLKPTDPAARVQLGLALMKSGRGREAVAPLMAAIRLGPGDPKPLIHLAQLLATCPDKQLRSADDAIFFASRAVELTRSQSADALDALAAAQAEKRDFAQAARTASRAEKIARDQGKAEQADQIAARAAIYRSGQPVRDTSLAGADSAELIP